MSEDQLILLVKNKPILYDRKHAEYRQIDLKEGIWKEIAQQLKISEQKCRSKWKALRDQFLREVKRKNYVPGDEIDIKWKHFHQLKFLLDKSYPRKNYFPLDANRSIVKRESMVKKENFMPPSMTLSNKQSPKSSSEKLSFSEDNDFVVPIPTEEDFLDVDYEDNKPIRVQPNIIRRKRRPAVRRDEPKRSLIQVQTTTLTPEKPIEPFPSQAPQMTNASLAEPIFEQTPSLPQPIQHIKTETEESDDGMDMFFQSVKRTMRSTNFSPMEKLDLQMSILQVIREKILLKNGNH